MSFCLERLDFIFSSLLVVPLYHSSEDFPFYLRLPQRRVPMSPICELLLPLIILLGAISGSTLAYLCSIVRQKATPLSAPPASQGRRSRGLAQKHPEILAFCVFCFHHNRHYFDPFPLFDPLYLLCFLLVKKTRQE